MLEFSSVVLPVPSPYLLYLFAIIELISFMLLPCVCVLDFDIEKCFLRDDVQSILKRITGFDLNKIFRERKIDDPGPPKYKLLTTKQLEEVHICHTSCVCEFKNV